MIPEGLVLMTSIAFAVGVVRLGRRGCLVQELPAIEGLARVDVLCLDKTGTLTAGGMELDRVLHLRDGLPVEDALASLAAADSRPNGTAKAIRASHPTAPLAAARHRALLLRPQMERRRLRAARDLAAGRARHPAGPRRRRLRPGRRAVRHRCPGAGAVPYDATCRRPEHGAPAALITLEQRVRPDAEETLRYFAAQGVTVKVISGDNPPPCRPSPPA